jgi:gamma-glutamylcyclotransferase (GGCT)/AIG2-like uncharacterized protein YtfP
MKLFVYGTLKRNGRYHYFLQGDEYLGKYHTEAKFRMFDLGSCPALTLDTVDGYPVEGEVYEVDNLRRFDNLEGYPMMYNRGIFAVGEHMATIYYMKHNLAAETELPSGVWMNCPPVTGVAKRI